MRTLRMASFSLVILSLVIGSSIGATATTEEPLSPISHVTGSLEVDQLPGGTFAVQDRVFQYRDYAMNASGARISDPRLAGRVLSDWNWDVHASGALPVPAWGTMSISTADGSWEGTFTGIKRGDVEPMGVRAFLLGEGDYEGLCATLDIAATRLPYGDSWVLDGIIHPVDMAG